MTGPDQRGERRAQDVTSRDYAIVGQRLIDNPGQTTQQLGELRDRGASKHALMLPLYSAVGHLITMPMLSDVRTILVSLRPSQPDTSVISAISPEILETHRKPPSVYTENKPEETAFMEAQMDRFDPYFSSVVGAMMNPEDPYHPIWREIKKLNSGYIGERLDKPRRNDIKTLEDVEDNTSYIFLGGAEFSYTC